MTINPKDLKVDYKFAREIISNYDKYSLTIKNWAITVWSLIIVFILTQYFSQNITIIDLYYFIPILLVVIFVFWYFDALFKHFQRFSLARSEAIEDYLNFSSFKIKSVKKDFLLFIASILIATSSYMILLFNSIKQRKREEKRKLKEAVRKRKTKVRKFKRFYETVRNLIIDVQKRAMGDYRSVPTDESGFSRYLGERVIDLSHNEKHLKLLDCKILGTNLIYSEKFLIDGFQVEVEYILDDGYIHLANEPEKMRYVLIHLERTFKNAKKKIS